ncbi:MAG: hypothetical protein WA991_12225 [Ornithinimicrobium sp.]
MFVAYSSVLGCHQLKQAGIAERDEGKRRLSELAVAVVVALAQRDAAV